MTALRNLIVGIIIGAAATVAYSSGCFDEAGQKASYTATWKQP